ncbi:MAG: phosphoribosylglycinamide synthetase C domain-containing protein, partial [Patescibacteria group bacterium]
GKLKIKNDGNYRIAVTAAPKGYPGDYSNVKGKKIFGIENAVKVKNVKIYGAGVKKENGNYIVSSGRLVHVVGVGKNVIEARKWAYQAMSLIYIEGNNLHYRTDIGSRDIERIYR